MAKDALEAQEGQYETQNMEQNPLFRRSELGKSYSEDILKNISMDDIIMGLKLQEENLTSVQDKMTLDIEGLLKQAKERVKQQKQDMSPQEYKKFTQENEQFLNQRFKQAQETLKNLEQEEKDVEKSSEKQQGSKQEMQFENQQEQSEYYAQLEHLNKYNEFMDVNKAFELNQQVSKQPEKEDLSKQMNQQEEQLKTPIFKTGSNKQEKDSWKEMVESMGYYEAFNQQQQMDQIQEIEKYKDFLNNKEAMEKAGIPREYSEYQYDPSSNGNSSNNSNGQGNANYRNSNTQRKYSFKKTRNFFQRGTQGNTYDQNASSGQSSSPSVNGNSNGNQNNNPSNGNNQEQDSGYKGFSTPSTSSFTQGIKPWKSRKGHRPQCCGGNAHLKYSQLQPKSNLLAGKYYGGKYNAGQHSFRVYNGMCQSYTLRFDMQLNAKPVESKSKSRLYAYNNNGFLQNSDSQYNSTQGYNEDVDSIDDLFQDTESEYEQINQLLQQDQSQNKYQDRRNIQNQSQYLNGGSFQDFGQFASQNNIRGEQEESQETKLNRELNSFFQSDNNDYTDLQGQVDNQNYNQNQKTQYEQSGQGLQKQQGPFGGSGLKYNADRYAEPDYNELQKFKQDVDKQFGGNQGQYNGSNQYNLNNNKAGNLQQQQPYQFNRVQGTQGASKMFSGTSIASSSQNQGIIKPNSQDYQNFKKGMDRGYFNKGDKMDLSWMQDYVVPKVERAQDQKASSASNNQQQKKSTIINGIEFNDLHQYEESAKEQEQKQDQQSTQNYNWGQNKETNQETKSRNKNNSQNNIAPPQSKSQENNEAPRVRNKSEYLAWLKSSINKDVESDYLNQIANDVIMKSSQNTPNPLDAGSKLDNNQPINYDNTQIADDQQKGNMQMTQSDNVSQSESWQDLSQSLQQDQNLQDDGTQQPPQSDEQESSDIQLQDSKHQAQSIQVGVPRNEIKIRQPNAQGKFEKQYQQQGDNRYQLRQCADILMSALSNGVGADTLRNLITVLEDRTKKNKSKSQRQLVNNDKGQEVFYGLKWNDNPKLTELEEKFQEELEKIGPEEPPTPKELMTPPNIKKAGQMKQDQFDFYRDNFNEQITKDPKMREIRPSVQVQDNYGVVDKNFGKSLPAEMFEITSPVPPSQKQKFSTLGGIPDSVDKHSRFGGKNFKPNLNGDRSQLNGQGGRAPLQGLDHNQGQVQVQNQDQGFENTSGMVQNMQNKFKGVHFQESRSRRFRQRPEGGRMLMQEDTKGSQPISEEELKATAQKYNLDYNKLLERMKHQNPEIVIE